MKLACTVEVRVATPALRRLIQPCVTHCSLCGRHNSGSYWDTFHFNSKSLAASSAAWPFPETLLFFLVKKENPFCVFESIYFGFSDQKLCNLIFGQPKSENMSVNEPFRFAGYCDPTDSDQIRSDHPARPASFPPNFTSCICCSSEEGRAKL